MMRKILALLVGLATLLAGGSVAHAATKANQGGSFTGTIDGAEYRVEVPERWNGTLMLYSHGFFPPGLDFPVPRVPVANADETEEWLLDHGYALAASEYQENGIGYQIESALGDQLALLDWFKAHIGRPHRTILVGQSLGATVATLLAERYPHRFDGVATVCGTYDPLATWNTTLDINFVVKTLLAPGEDIDLVRAGNPTASRDALLAAIDRLRDTPEGQARLALAAAVGNVTGWYTSLEPKPTELTEWISQQTQWVYFANVFGRGPVAMADIEQRAGGNPLWNVGVDYARQLARSSQREVVRQAYQAAGLDLREDLAALAAAPRIAPDPGAIRYMYRFGIPRGATPMPVISLHTTGDGGAPPHEERWYAQQVRRNGDPERLRQLYVERGGHCSFNAAEEVVTLRALLIKIDTGRWPNLSPRRLNPVANRFDPHFHQVLDLGTFDKQVLPPAFTSYTPPRPLRPSR
jgi:pimeloyl-ACP methyl ester carboxylesterase